MGRYEKKVNDFMSIAADMIGKFERDNFSMEMHSRMWDAVKSPIEEYLFIAVSAVARLNMIEPLTVKPQHMVGKYRADFLISYKREDNTEHSIVVECDSQAFHDRTEEERRYEKARQRYFVMQGYRVAHYTGKEILERPIATASEILAFLANQPAEGLSSWVSEFNDELE